MTTATGPFAGVRIIDLSTVVAGPMGTGILADQGADVIKVEAPGLGDMLRYQGTQRGGMSGTFHVLNRGKRSISLDLKRPEGRAVLLRLIAGADVVFHNFRPKVMGRLGLGYETLRELNPDLIYVSVSGYGDEGPMADKPAYDQMVQCFAGYAAVQGGASGDGQTPVPINMAVLDKLTAVYAAQAISAALYARATGRGGQEVKLSMLSVGLSFLWPDAAKREQVLSEDADVRATPAEMYRLYRFKGGWATFNASDASFTRLCEILKAPLGADERLHTRIGRFGHRDLMDEIERQWAAGAAELDIDEGMALLEAADVPCARVLTLEEIAEHPQVEAAGVFRISDHPQIGPIREPNHPIAFAATPASVGGPAPTPGRDTAAVLAELGLSEAEITAVMG